MLGMTRLLGTTRPRLGVAVALLGALLACQPAHGAVDAPQSSARWWKGNMHTHSLWSDGDDFPEMIADWYKRNGYHFLALTDHNTVATEERWWPVPATGLAPRGVRQVPRPVRCVRRAATCRRHVVRFVCGGRASIAPQLDEPGKFLLVVGEEITQYLERRGAHMNALNLVDVIPAQPGATLVEMLRHDLEAVRAQEQRTGREINAVFNHPNFLWSQTAEDLLELPALRFFEVYNGHPLVNILGDSVHASNERIWTSCSRAASPPTAGRCTASLRTTRTTITASGRTSGIRDAGGSSFARPGSTRTRS